VVCDDDPVVRRLVLAILQRCGYTEVDQTAFADEAVELAEVVQPRVVVLDLSLEGTSGVEAIPRLREVAPESAVVVFSGSRELKGEARQAGADAVLDKVSMVNLSELEAVLSGLGR
jgi:CheY-like chemotaxis protein